MGSRDYKQALGEAVRDRRAELRLSQEALAELTKVTQQYVSLVESGKNDLRLSSILTFASALQIAPSELLRAAEDIDRP